MKPSKYELASRLTPFAPGSGVRKCSPNDAATNIARTRQLDEARFAKDDETRAIQRQEGEGGIINDDNDASAGDASVSSATKDS